MNTFLQIITVCNSALILFFLFSYFLLGKDTEKVLEYMKTTERDLLHTIQELNGEIHMLKKQIEILAAQPPKTVTKAKTNTKEN